MVTIVIRRFNKRNLQNNTFTKLDFKIYHFVTNKILNYLLQDN